MTPEQTTRLMKTEIEVQRKLIEMLVQFYDATLDEEGINPCTSLMSKISKAIEKDYDLDQHRPKKKVEEEEEVI